MQTDRGSGDVYTFKSQPNIELRETDGEQSWLYVEPKINQSGTAAYNGLKIRVTETAVGSGATGINATNNLIVAGTSGNTNAFVVDRAGSTAIDGTFHAVGAITSDAGCCADYVFDSNYELLTIEETESYVAKVGHLPGMTQGVGNEKKSLDLTKAIGELIVKVEEQSLYIAQLHGRIKQLEGGK